MGIKITKDGRSEKEIKSRLNQVKMIFLRRKMYKISQNMLRVKEGTNRSIPIRSQPFSISNDATAVIHERFSVALGASWRCGATDGCVDKITDMEVPERVREILT